MYFNKIKIKRFFHKIVIHITLPFIIFFKFKLKIFFIHLRRRREIMADRLGKVPFIQKYGSAIKRFFKKLLAWLTVIGTILGIVHLITKYNYFFNPGNHPNITGLTHYRDPKATKRKPGNLIEDRPFAHKFKEYKAMQIKLTELLKKQRERNEQHINDEIYNLRTTIVKTFLNPVWAAFLDPNENEESWRKFSEAARQHSKNLIDSFQNHRATFVTDFLNPVLGVVLTPKDPELIKKIAGQVFPNGDIIRYHVSNEAVKLRFLDPETGRLRPEWALTEHGREVLVDYHLDLFGNLIVYVRGSKLSEWERGLIKDYYADCPKIPYDLPYTFERELRTYFLQGEPPESSFF